MRITSGPVFWRRLWRGWRGDSSSRTGEEMEGIHVRLHFGRYCSSTTLNRPTETPDEVGVSIAGPHHHLDSLPAREQQQQGRTLSLRPLDPYNKKVVEEAKSEVVAQHWRWWADREERLLYFGNDDLGRLRLGFLNPVSP